MKPLIFEGSIFIPINLIINTIPIRQGGYVFHPQTQLQTLNADTILNNWENAYVLDGLGNEKKNDDTISIYGILCRSSVNSYCTSFQVIFVYKEKRKCYKRCLFNSNTVKMIQSNTFNMLSKRDDLRINQLLHLHKSVELRRGCQLYHARMRKAVVY